jgi:hypothetical protein
MDKCLRCDQELGDRKEDVVIQLVGLKKPPLLEDRKVSGKVCSECWDWWLGLLQS